MSIDPKLREIIRCPQCKGQLTDSEAGFDCVACQLSFPLRDGIPVLLVDEASPIG